MSEIEKLFPFAFPFFFVGIWFVVLRNLSFMSGWDKLAERYHHPEKFRGKLYRFRSGRMSRVNFSSCLNMGVDASGLYLTLLIPFRPFHKPLLIPWEEIRVEPFKKFLLKGHRLRFRSFPGITLELYGRTFVKMIEHLKAHTDFLVPD